MSPAKYSSKQKTKEDTFLDAPPPMSAVILVVGLLLTFGTMLPPLWEDLNGNTSIEMLTTPLFPEYMSVKSLGFIRLGMAVMIWMTSGSVILDPKGITVRPNYGRGSLLTTTEIPLQGLWTLSMFTHWAWLVLGVACSLNAAIALSVAYSMEIPSLLLPLALLSFELAAPLSFLVSFVVTWGIWPQALHSGGSLDDLEHPRTLMMHNANILYCLIEVGLLGGLPVQLGNHHMVVAPLFGLVYVMFTWSMRNQWLHPKGESSHFLYHFMDTTLGMHYTLALVILLLVLLMAYALFGCIDELLGMLGDKSVLNHFLAIVAIAGVTCRFGP